MSGRGRSSTKQIERVPQGCFGVATYEDTVSAQFVNCNAQYLKKTKFRTKSVRNFFCPGKNELIQKAKNLRLFALKTRSVARRQEWHRVWIDPLPFRRCVAIRCAAFTVTLLLISDDFLRCRAIFPKRWQQSQNAKLHQFAYFLF